MNIPFKCLAFLLFFVAAQQAHASPDLYHACDTAKDYKKLQSYFRSLTDPSDQVIEHLRKELKQKYKHLSRKQRMQSPEFQRDMKKALQEFRPTRPAPPKVACRKIPGNTVLVENSGSFSGIACVKATSWSKCKWTGRNALKARWTPTADRKIWRKK